ncbi:MAG TPA: S41 family peptidase [Nitrospirota bacterium]|nr:S41 family peptidase [Nitrospirota bacterium]
MKIFVEEGDMIKISRKKFIAAALVLLLTGTFVLLTTGILIGQEAVQSRSGTYEELKAFTQALELVRRNYVENPNSKELVEGAIRGMIAGLDPHSSYMSERQFKEMSMDIKGEFQGVGIQIGVKNAQLTIIAPIEGTPGDRAGLAAGDKILRINEEWTKDLSIEQAVDKMRGPKGTSVRLLILREGWEKPKEFKITRDTIKVQSVKSKMLDDGIGYVKLIQFQGQTASELELALKGLEAKGIKKLILDMRNNPGGILDTSVDVSGKFLPKDKLVVYLQGRQKTDRKDYLTTSSEPPREYPMVVLVNTGSASASEIVAGALQDSKRALIVGTQTFGKGSVQTVFPLEDGGGIRLTTAKYYTPNGRSIQNVGITPDIEVKLPTVKEPKDGDSVHIMMREKDLERHLKNETVKEEKKKEHSLNDEDFSLETMPKDEKDDIQIQKAIEILKAATRADDVFKNIPVAVKKEK